MPIVVTPTQPDNIFTPGGWVSGQSDFIGPFPTNTIWRWTLFADSGETRPTAIATFQNFGKTDGFHLLTQAANRPVQIANNMPVESSSVRLLAEIVTDTGVIDSGAATMPWSPVAGLGIQSMINSTTAQTGGGLTPTESQQLQETHDSAAITIPLDSLLLVSLSSGPSPGPLSAFLTSPVFGVIVRIATIPEQLLPNTPDGDYWVKTLAVCRIYRGSDLWLRIPIHTSSKIINLWVEGLALGLADLIINGGWLLNLSVQVTFLAGVTGEAFLMRTP